MSIWSSLPAPCNDEATRGRERLHDLSVLCRDCHSRFHTDAA